VCTCGHSVRTEVKRVGAAWFISPCTPVSFRRSRRALINEAYECNAKASCAVQRSASRSTNKQPARSGTIRSVPSDHVRPRWAAASIPHPPARANCALPHAWALAVAANRAITRFVPMQAGRTAAATKASTIIRCAADFFFLLFLLTHQIVQTSSYSPWTMKTQRVVQNVVDNTNLGSAWLDSSGHSEFFLFLIFLFLICRHAPSLLPKH